MKHSTFIIGFSLLFLSFFSDSIHEKNNNKTKASSILYITNTTSSTYITMITVNYSQPWHNPSTVVINTSIPPNGGTQTLDFGNTSENITLTLTFSRTTSGSIQDTQTDPYNCPWMACSHFSNSLEESVSFYFYGVNYLYLTNSAGCFC